MVAGGCRRDQAHDYPSPRWTRLMGELRRKNQVGSVQLSA